MILDFQWVKSYIRICEDGWLQGWHERNGGNLTYRLSKEEKDQAAPFCSFDRPWVPLGVCAKNMAGEAFLATGSGKYFRNVPLDPKANISIVHLNESGDAYRVVWGLRDGGRPTSELPSHILNHSVRAEATQGKNRVIYHAHPANIIAMTYLLPLTAKDFSRALWQSATECPVVFPGGIGVVEWMVPGGSAIALQTSELMKEYDAAVWAHHGLFVSGPDLDTAFGLMHTIEKAAQIYMLVHSVTKDALQTIPDEGLRAIAKEFKVNLREEFLEK